MTDITKQTVSTIITLGLLLLVYLSAGAVGTLATIGTVLFWVYAVLGTIATVVIVAASLFAPTSTFQDVHNKSAWWWVKSVLMGALCIYVFLHAGWTYVAVMSILSWVGILVILSRTTQK